MTPSECGYRQIQFNRRRIATGVIAAEGEQICTVDFSRVDMVSCVCSGICTFPAVGADGRIDGVDRVLGKEQLGRVRTTRRCGVVS